MSARPLVVENLRYPRGVGMERIPGQQGYGLEVIAQGSIGLHAGV